MKRRTKQIFISGIVGLFLIATWFILKHVIYGYQTYVNAKNKFTIGFPKGWEKKEKVSGADVIFFSPLTSDIDTFKENVTVVVQDLGNDKPDSLSEYSTVAIDQIIAVFGHNLEIQDNNPFWELSGRTAHRLSFVGQGPGDGTSFKYLMVWTVDKRKGKAYQVTYAGSTAQFDFFLEEAERMIKSFKIRE